MYIHPILFSLPKFCCVCKEPSLFASAKCSQTPSVATSEHTLDWFEDENKRGKQKHCSALISLIRHICYISGEFPFRAFEMHEADSLPICWFFPLFCWPPFCLVAFEGTLTASWENLLSWMLCALCTYYSNEPLNVYWFLCKFQFGTVFLRLSLCRYV